jgi:hypothetical protein
MLRRYLGLARAFSASALLALTSLPGTSPADEPASGADAIPILKAQCEGLLSVDLRGQGEDRVQVQLRNTSDRRLNVVIPPGLVAASTSGQGGGFQSMGLGTPTRAPGSFGAFRGSGSGSGFQAVPVEGQDPPEGIAVPAGKTVSVSLPSVCLNYGLPTPTPRDHFRLVDVDDYTADQRARKALRSLATLGTSQKVAQAVVWHAFNGMTIEQMAHQARRYLNLHELTVAARFIQALDASGSSELVEPAYFQQARIFVHVRVGENSLAKDAARLASELETQSLLGLPVRVVREVPGEEAGPSALLVSLGLVSTTPSQTRGRLQVAYRAIDGSWQPLGQPTFQVAKTATALDAATLADALDRTLAGAFVSAKVVRKNTGTTTLRLDNRLPFSIAAVSVRTGKEADSGSVRLDGLGLGPARSTLAVIPAAGGVVERVELNGL